MGFSTRTVLAASLSTLLMSVAALVLLLTANVEAGWPAPLGALLAIALVSLWYLCLRLHYSVRRASRAGSGVRPSGARAIAAPPIGRGMSALLAAATITAPIVVVTGMLFQFGLGLYVGVSLDWVVVEFTAMVQSMRG